MSEKRKGEHTRTFRLKVTTKVMQLVSKNPKRCNVLVYNVEDETVYVLSAQNLKAADGIPVVAGATYTNDTTTARLYIVAASGTQDVRVQVDSE